MRPQLIKKKFFHNKKCSREKQPTEWEKVFASHAITHTVADTEIHVQN